MEMHTLRDLYIAELKDLYSAEQQLVRALPKMAKNATNPQLRQAFENHLEETKRHVARLDQIFQMLDTSPGGKHCKGMEGLIQEGEELLEKDAHEHVRDAGLISKAQHVEHYEIAGYGTVRSYADILGEVAHAQLLEQTLEEEAAADELLTELAVGSINIAAAIGDEAAEAGRGFRGRDTEREVRRVAHSDRPDTSTPRRPDRAVTKDADRDVRDR